MAFIVHLSLESDCLMYVSNYSLQNIAISALNCAYSLLGLECILATHICLYSFSFGLPSSERL